MCGICGFSGHANDGLLDQMGNAIRHRGPDGLGCYSDGRMNLCSRRLSIVDPVSGGQPVEMRIPRFLRCGTAKFIITAH